jgi:hypothetical protein
MHASLIPNFWLPTLLKYHDHATNKASDIFEFTKQETSAFFNASSSG